MVAGVLGVTIGCGDDGSAMDGSATTQSMSGAEASGASLDETGVPSGSCELQESFDVADGQPWPAAWSAVGGVALADVQGGRGRLVPIASGYSLARMFTPLDCVDAEATFTFELSDGGTQGVGFYVRQNGGYLQATTPRGQGYAAFAESFRMPAGIGAWREIDGEEQMIEAIAPFALEVGVVYRVRLRVTQTNASTTRIQTRVWRDGEAEPAAWQVERSDGTAALQGLGGGIAVDAWSSLTSGEPFALFVDDIVVTAAG